MAYIPLCAGPFNTNSIAHLRVNQSFSIKAPSKRPATAVLRAAATATRYLIKVAVHIIAYLRVKLAKVLFI